MNTKIVPDPPHTPTAAEKCDVVRQVIGRCSDYLDPHSSVTEPPSFGAIERTASLPADYHDAHKLPVFTVREGIDVEAALKHVSYLLKSAEYVADDLSTPASGLASDQLWSIVHSVEMARAVVEALLSGAHRPHA